MFDSQKLVVAAFAVIVFGHSAFAGSDEDCRKFPPITEEQRQKADGFNAIGVELSNRGDKMRAAEIFLEATVKYPEYSISWNNAGIGLSVFTGQHEKSLPYFRQAICIDPSFAMAHYFYGTALYELGNYPESEVSFKRAIELDPAYSRAKNNLASIYLRTKRYKKALRILEELARETPNDFLALNNLAAAHFYNKDLKSAEATFVMLTELFPDRHIAQFNLAIVYIHRGRRTEAIRVQRKLQQTGSELAEILYEGLFGNKVLSFRQQ